MPRKNIAPEIKTNIDINSDEFNTNYEKIRKRSKSATEAQSKLRAMLELVSTGIEESASFK